MPIPVAHNVHHMRGIHCPAAGANVWAYHKVITLAVEFCAVGKCDDVVPGLISAPVAPNTVHSRALQAGVCGTHVVFLVFGAISANSVDVLLYPLVPLCAYFSHCCTRVFPTKGIAYMMCGSMGCRDSPLQDFQFSLYSVLCSANRLVVLAAVPTCTLGDLVVVASQQQGTSWQLVLAASTQVCQALAICHVPPSCRPLTGLWSFGQGPWQAGVWLRQPSTNPNTSCANPYRISSSSLVAHPPSHLFNPLSPAHPPPLTFALPLSGYQASVQGPSQPGII